MAIELICNTTTVDVDGVIAVEVGGDIGGITEFELIEWAVRDTNGIEVGEWTNGDQQKAYWIARNLPVGVYRVSVRVVVAVTEKVSTRNKKVSPEDTAEMTLSITSKAVHLDGPIRLSGPIEVDLERAQVADTPDLALWELIKTGTDAVSFERYAAWIDHLFCGGDSAPWGEGEAREFKNKLGGPSDGNGSGRPILFPEIEAYDVLKAATEAFLELNCGVFDNPKFPKARKMDPDTQARLELDPGDSLGELWDKYLVHTSEGSFIPYLYRVRQKLRDVELTDDPLKGELCDKILESKLTGPCLLELIWSYWQEEGMLVQTVNSITMRFQNRRSHGGHVDPLANLTIDPLRPLGNLLWGYIQDEYRRLTIPRRAYEYDSEYGLTLLGQAVPPLHGADSRSTFLEAFHNLLHRASLFYKEDDDTTMIADAFPVLNALREVHLVLAEGANNQYRDLPWTARSEMLMQQWLLARSEFREFLPTRVMVVYPEPWMDRVDAMKRLQGWTDTSVRFFRDLAVFGEKILLSIRFGDWSNITNRDDAANWARFWRQEVQWYIHAYQAVTGVDLSADMADMRLAEQARARALPPAFHLQRRMIEQHRGRVPAQHQLPQPTGAPR